MCEYPEKHPPEQRYQQKKQKGFEKVIYDTEIVCKHDREDGHGSNEKRQIQISRHGVFSRIDGHLFFMGNF